MKFSLLTSAALFVMASGQSVSTGNFSQIALQDPQNWMAGDSLSKNIITSYTVNGANYTDGGDFAKYIQTLCAPPDCNTTLSFYMEYNLFNKTTETNTTISEWRGFTIGAGRPVTADDLARAPSILYFNFVPTDVTVNNSMVYNRIYTN